MISKKSVQCVIDRNKKRLEDAYESITNNEVELNNMDDKWSIDAQMCRGRLSYYEAQICAYREIIEDLESIINY